MRLWHYILIPYIPKQQLLGQHRECCCLRGLGWNKKHYIVNYVFNSDFSYLMRYHRMIMIEMIKRGIKIRNVHWWNECYRGKKIGFVKYFKLPNINGNRTCWDYPEHNNDYLRICLHNLKYSISDSTKKPKGIDLFMHFPFIKDLGYSLDEYEKKLRNNLFVF